MASCRKRSNDVPQEKFEMMLDCGPNYHMIKDLYRLLNVVKLPQNIEADEPFYVPRATHRGDLKVEISNRLNEWTKIILKDVLCEPNLKQDLLSAERIVSSGKYELKSCRDFTDIVDVETGKVTCSAVTKKLGKFFSVRQTFDEETIRKEIVTLWHRRLAHLSAEEMQHLPNCAKGLPPNFRVKDDDFDDCDACLKVK